MFVYTKEHIRVFIHNDIVPQMCLLSEMDTTEDDRSPLILDVCIRDMQRIILYCEHYMIEPMYDIHIPICNTQLHQDVQTWYVAFIECIPILELFEFMNSVQYIHINPLYKLILTRIIYFIRTQYNTIEF
jgi:hypothetical protein